MIRNALFWGSTAHDDLLIPYCTYTDPELAQVGMTEQALTEQKIAYDVYSKDLAHNDRALCEGRKGLYKVYCVTGTDKILGATLVGGPAGDLITHVTAAMHNKIGMAALGTCVHPYPTYAETFKGMAGDYNRKRLTPASKSCLRKIISCRR